MNKLFLYAHGGSGNHGCEALVRSTLKILNSQDVTLISSHPEEDNKYGLDKLCTIVKDTYDHYSKVRLDSLKAYMQLKIHNNYIPIEKLRYKKAFSNIRKGDIALSIGGDNYCYADVEKYMMLHDIVISRGAKTVLWGCSIEPEIAIKPNVSEDLSKYDLITARETITYETLKKINPNTVLVSDPAFQLDMEKTELPDEFILGNTVGINLSPMVMENESVSGITWENYTFLVDYILTHTDMNIALVPHVVWQESDDRKPLKRLYDTYRNTSRVCLIEDTTCTKLKYIISKCRFFVGARTHSTIAAYSTGVPTLVLGYSVKSKGIARYLFGSEKNLVVSAQDLNEKSKLYKCFALLIENETFYRSVLAESNARRTNAIENYEDLIRCLG